jgi:hypothetical protein
MGVGGEHHAPAALPPWQTRYPLHRRQGGHQSQCGRVRKISPPTGIRSPDCPARCESLYQLSCHVFWVVLRAAGCEWRVRAVLHSRMTTDRTKLTCSYCNTISRALTNCARWCGKHSVCYFEGAPPHRYAVAHLVAATSPQVSGSIL